MDRLPKILSVGVITNVTFYQWRDLKCCHLKGLARALNLDGRLPERPLSRAILVGRFFHRVMELAATTDHAVSLARLIEMEIANLQSILIRTPALRKEGSASGWDEVNRAAILALETSRAGGAVGQGKQRGAEVDLRSTGGLLVGRPDYFSVSSGRALLREYKSGGIRDTDGNPREEFIEQLRFYACLIFDNADVTNVIGSIHALNGDSVDMEVSRDEAKSYADNVASTVHKLNQDIRALGDISALATPNRECCHSCQMKLLCERFKQSQDELELEGEQFISEGDVRSIGRSDAGTTVPLVIFDKYRKRNVNHRVPTSVALEISTGQKVAFVDLRKHGATLQWGHTSKALYCE